MTTGSGDDRDDMGLMGRPLPLDEHSADRLLAGSIAVDDAPPGYEAVVRVLDAAGAGLGADSVPSGADAGACERGLTAAMQAAVLGRAVPVSDARRKRMRSMLVAPRAAAVAAAVVLGGGTAAAALTGSLPNQASSHAGGTGLGVASSHGTATGGSNSGKPGSNVPTNPPSSVPADQNAAFGLCTAFLANGGSPGANRAAPPFAGLVAAHGGVPATTTYCQGVVGTHPGSPAGGTPGQPSVPSDNSSSHAPVNTPNTGGAGTADTASGGAGANGASTANGAGGGASQNGTSTAGAGAANGTSTANSASNGASSAGSGNSLSHTSH